MIKIEPIEAFTDNYIWLVTTNEGSIVIDPGESSNTINFLEKNQLDLSLIMANVERNQIGMIVQMIESVQSYIITKNFGKKNVGIDFIYIFQKTIIL